jgi:hypothetical protein
VNLETLAPLADWQRWVWCRIFRRHRDQYGDLAAFTVGIQVGSADLYDAAQAVVTDGSWAWPLLNPYTLVASANLDAIESAIRDAGGSHLLKVRAIPNPDACTHIRCRQARR